MSARRPFTSANPAYGSCLCACRKSVATLPFFFRTSYSTSSNMVYRAVTTAARTCCVPLLFQTAGKPPAMAAASRSLFTAGTSRKAVAGITLFQRFNKPSFRSISALTDAQVIQRPSDTEKWKRIAATTAAVVIGAGALSFLNNRETRDPLSPFEASYLNKTFTYVGVGLGITASSAYALHKTGASFRIMRANPWLVIGGSLAAGIGTMIMAMRTAPENTGAKHFWWTAFNVAQSATLSPLLSVPRLSIAY